MRNATLVAVQVVGMGPIVPENQHSLWTYGTETVSNTASGGAPAPQTNVPFTSVMGPGVPMLAPPASTSPCMSKSSDLAISTRRDHQMSSMAARRQYIPDHIIGLKDPTIVRHGMLSAFTGDAIDNARKAIAAAANTFPPSLNRPCSSYVASCGTRMPLALSDRVGRTLNVGDCELFPLPTCFLDLSIPFAQYDNRITRSFPNPLAAIAICRGRTILRCAR